jgi:CRISPR-associated protein (TIGR02584 family)
VDTGGDRRSTARSRRARRSVPGAGGEARSVGRASRIVCGNGSTSGSVPVALCLAGLSPAVISETLYGLATRRHDPVVPHEVHVVTTHGGYPVVAAALLGPRGALVRLREQYRLPAGSLRCGPEQVHVLVDAGGRPLDDIRDGADSRAAGEFIGQLVRRLGARDRVVLHCSLAGGRKTMSALLATALQLHGRPGDRLYHVLVSEPFERVPDFFFPPRPPARYRLEGRWVCSDAARIELAEVPFVPLGAAARLLGYGDLALERIAEELQAEARGRLVPDPLTVVLRERKLTVGPVTVRLSPQEIALYALYAELRAGCRTPGCRAGGACAGCHMSDDDVHERRQDLWRLYTVAQPHAGGRLAALLGGEAQEADDLTDFRAWLQQTRSRLNRVIGNALGRGPRGRRYRVLPARTVETGRRRGLGVPPRFIRGG